MSRPRPTSERARAASPEAPAGKALRRPALRWYGGKWRLAPWIIGHLPPHDAYVEPYGGAASVLLRKPPAKLETFNDLHGRLVNFFTVVREHPDELVQAIELTPYARGEFQLAYQAVSDSLEDARRLFVLACQGRGGAASGRSRTGWRTQRNPANASPPAEFTAAHLRAVAARLKHVQIERDDALAVIEHYDHPATLHYVDPPYPRAVRSAGGSGRYTHDLSDADHRTLAEVLHRVKGMVVLSGCPNQLYEALYPGWLRLDHQARDDAANLRVESLWLNPAAQHRSPAATASNHPGDAAPLTLEGRAITHVRIPADVEREDRLLAGLTARQLLVLALAGLGAGFIVTIARRVLPLPLALGLAGPVAVAGLVLALARVHGLPGDRFALAMLDYLDSPRRQVPAPAGVVPPPPWATKEIDLPAPLTLPAKDLYSNGIIDLGPDGASLVCRASTINFRLRTEEEQEAAIAAFARFLNAVSTPVQIVVRSERADLRTSVAQLRQRAGELPHPALEGAALGHAQFLERLTARRDVLRRELLLVFREPATGGDPATVLPRRAEQAAALLASAGVDLTVLDHDDAADLLARAGNPDGPPRPAGLAPPGQTITRRPS